MSIRKLAIIFALLMAEVVSLPAASTTFHYHGVLNHGGVPATGDFDFIFTLFDAATGGSVQGTSFTNGVRVNGGLFTVSLDFGGSVFDGDPRWLEIRVKRADGAGPLTTLDPRQPLGTVPYAVFAATTGQVKDQAVGTAGLQNSAVTAEKLAAGGTPSDGQVLAYSDAGLRWITAPLTAWSLVGNAGTDPDEEFVGTTDDRAPTFRVHSQTALRILPSDTGNPSIVGGHPANRLVTGHHGAVIAGGGSLATPNLLDGGYFSFLGGGRGNYARDQGNVLVGGFSNRIGDSFEFPQYNFVGGGEFNEIDADFAFIGGGSANRVLAHEGTVAGGGFNTVVGDVGTVGGGGNNVAGYYDTVAGGSGNRATGRLSVVAGGETNEVTGVWSVIAGGLANGVEGASSSVGGGTGNRIWSDVQSSIIGGGAANSIRADLTSFFVGGSTIAGGQFNAVNAGFATIGGGQQNNIGPLGIHAVVPGGFGNTANAPNAFAAGNRAAANHDGAFVWADHRPNGGEFSSTADNQFLIRAQGGVGINTNSPTEALEVHGNIKASRFIGDGSMLTGVSGSSDGWSRSGNAGIADGSFLGTTDPRPLDIRVNNQRALRMESPDFGNNGPRIIGGHPDNRVVRGDSSVIAGGGSSGAANVIDGGWGFVGGGSGNRVTNALAAIVGGFANVASGQWAFVGGGGNNYASNLYAAVMGGYNNLAGQYGSVGGGYNNRAAGQYGAIAGGYFNLADAPSAAVGGGSYNWARETYASVGGGYDNQALGSASTIAGGENNNATTNWATISGGNNNTATGVRSTISGGEGNLAQATNSVIAGGVINLIAPLSLGASIGGGGVNSVYDNSRWSAIAAGYQNGIGANATNAFIGGGSRNRAAFGSHLAVISGGEDNFVAGVGAALGGGLRNQAWGPASTLGGGDGNRIEPAGSGATISGGVSNLMFATGTIGGGMLNTNLAASGTIGGGSSNLIDQVAANAVIPGGQMARARSQGQFAHAGGAFAKPGDAQASVFVVRGRSQNNATSQLALDGGNESIRVPDGAVWTFRLQGSGVQESGSEFAGYEAQGVVSHLGGVISLVLKDAAGNPIGTAQPLHETTAGWQLTPYVDGSGPSARLRVAANGGLGQGFVRWVATLQTTEVMR